MKRRARGRPRAVVSGLGGRGRGYAFDLRVRIVKEVVEGGVSPAELARVFGIGRSTIDNWRRRTS